MSTKAFLFVGLLLAIVLVISSEVAARDLAETTTDEETSKFNDLISLFSLATTSMYKFETGIYDAEENGKIGFGECTIYAF